VEHIAFKEKQDTALLLYMTKES